METPNNNAGKITEKIMLIFSSYNSSAIIKLETKEYNKIYSSIYNILSDSDNAMSNYYDKFESKLKRLEEILNHKPSGKEEAIELLAWLEGEVSAMKDRVTKCKVRTDAWTIIQGKDVEKEFSNSDEICEWAVKNAYQLTNFNNGSAGDVIRRDTQAIVGSWFRDKQYKFKVYINP